MNRGDRFHARGTGPRWPGAAGRRCRVWKVTWTVRDKSARSRVLWDVTICNIGRFQVYLELLEYLSGILGNVGNFGISLAELPYNFWDMGNVWNAPIGLCT